MVMMQVAGVPAGVVSNAQDLFEDPQLKYYHHFHELDHPAMGKCAFYQGPGFRLSEADYEVAVRPYSGNITSMFTPRFLASRMTISSSGCKKGFSINAYLLSMTAFDLFT